jgi:hypothetical protein
MTFTGGSGLGLTMAGPGGVLFSLGIETLGVLSSTQIWNIYNWAAVLLICITAVSASMLDKKAMIIITPIVAGFTMWAGWLNFNNSPNPSASMATEFGILIICVVIGIVQYMTEVQHERFGIAGPGNKVVKLFWFLIILQAVVGMVNQSSIFPSDVQPLSTTNSNPEYRNINLNTEMTEINSAGGLTAAVVDIVSIAGQLAASILLLLLKMIISLAAFSVIMYGVFPWFAQAGVAGVLILGIIQLGIWLMYVMFIFTIYYKPSPDPGY